MGRENSFSDSDGRSLTPDLEEEAEFLESTQRNGQSPPAGVAPIYPISTPSQENITISPTPAQNFKSPIFPVVTPATQYQSILSPLQWPNPSPKEKFRAAVRKVISMHRGTSSLRGGIHVGAEPGVDPRRSSADAMYGHIHQYCRIEILDYSSLRSSVRLMGNEEFVQFLCNEEESQRPPWVKVRWINIGGISWDVIKALSLKYDLHPLALEDVFHGHRQTRSKADYYERHLFLRILCHQLQGSGEDAPFLPDIPHSLSPEPIDLSGKTRPADNSGSTESPHSSLRNRWKKPILPFHSNDIDDVTKGFSELDTLVQGGTRRREIQQATLEALKGDARVHVSVSPMFIFMFRDGIVISINAKTGLEFTNPISQRLRSRDTVLRKSADPSLLVHGLLDLIVDRALEVTDAYHDQINKYERDILLRLNNKTLRSLHILSGDLILHKRTMEPIKTLIYGMRRYDVDRCAALIDTSDPKNAGVQVVGYMSHKAKIYLADVHDHMEYILTSLDMFSSIAENLINYSFNSASYEMNIVMRKLTLITIIGLPLTLLTGYFGMNFGEMWSVNNNSDLFFWELAIPIFVVTTSLAMWRDILGMYHYVQKKMFARKVAATKLKST